MDNKFVSLLSYGGETANTYVYGEPGKPCLVFDFGDDSSHRVESFCAKSHPYIAGIFLTHGHVDHIGGLNDLTVLPSLRVIIHAEDEPCLYDARLNASASLFGKPFTVEKELPLYLCEDEDEIFLGAAKVKGPNGEDLTLGGYTVTVIHTPFHTAGSCCYYLKEQGILFSGDTLFHLGIGRTDLPGAQPRYQEASLAKLKALPPETIVYPGHGSKTSLGQEFRFNPFLQGIK